MRETLNSNYSNVFLLAFRFALSFDLIQIFISLSALSNYWFFMVAPLAPLLSISFHFALFSCFRDRVEFLNNHIGLKSWQHEISFVISRLDNNSRRIKSEITKRCGN